MPELFTWKITGLDKAQRLLREAPKREAKQTISDALQAGAHLGKGAMQRNAPKDTGFLEKHFDIKIRMFREGGAGVAFVGPQGKIDCPERAGGWRDRLTKKGKKRLAGRIPVLAVARFLEFGTSKMAARPWLTRSIEAVKRDIVDAMARRIIDGIERMKGYAR